MIAQLINLKIVIKETHLRMRYHSTEIGNMQKHYLIRKNIRDLALH